MKKFTYSICLALFSLAATHSPLSASCSTCRLGVVNLKRCLEESKFGKRETEELEKMKKKFAENSEKMEEELTALYKKLQDEDYMESISSSASEELHKKFEALSAEYSALQSQYYQAIGVENIKRLQNLLQAVKKASEKVKAEKNLTAILNDETVFAIDSSADMTDDVIKILDGSFKNN